MSIEDRIRRIRKKLRKKLPDWVNFQNLIFLTVILAFIVIVVWSESISQLITPKQSEYSIVTRTPTILPGTPTPVPAELLSSAEQTNGILIGAIIIVFSIIVGTIVMILRDITQ
jgi:hypothetical protein